MLNVSLALLDAKVYIFTSSHFSYRLTFTRQPRIPLINCVLGIVEVVFLQTGPARYDLLVAFQLSTSETETDRPRPTALT